MWCSVWCSHESTVQKDHVVSDVSNKLCSSIYIWKDPDQKTKASKITVLTSIWEPTHPVTLIFKLLCVINLQVMVFHHMTFTAWKSMLPQKHTRKLHFTRLLQADHLSTVFYNKHCHNTESVGSFFVTQAKRDWVANYTKLGPMA